MNKELYYVCSANIGITHFENNDSMSGISASKDKNKWLKLSLEKAKLIEDHTGWKIINIKDLGSD